MGTVTEIRKPQPPEKVVRLTRTPAWIRRMQANQTKPKDTTGWVNGALTPRGDGGAA